MKKINITLTGIFCILMITGCMTHTARINDTFDVYSMQTADAPKIIITDLNDQRADTKKVGRVGALDLNTETPVNTLITNRIAHRLKQEGFNVQKVHFDDNQNKTDIGQVLDYNNGDIYMRGGLENFYIASFDAIMEKATGKVSFYITMLDKTGNVIIDNTYSAQAERLIGLTGQFGSEKLIEETIQAAVDKLFSDGSFVETMSKGIKH